ncbi:MAG: PAS domain-containing protein, partial [Candidatus Marinimicrobia bacterium]|nr:PAS domain-containing protein [Candidatus Neomarinimicrobiota bacterium]
MGQASSNDGGRGPLKTSNEQLYRGNVLQDPSVVRNQDMVILSLDHQYRYLYFNNTHSEAMKQTYGTKPVIGDCIFDHIKIDLDANEVKKYYDKALSGEGHISIRESGSGLNRSIYRTFYNPIYNDKNEILGVSVFAQDVTAQNLAEKKMQESDRLRELL